MPRKITYYQIDTADLDMVIQVKSLFTYIEQNVFGFPEMDLVRNPVGNKILMRVDEAQPVPSELQSVLSGARKFRDMEETVRYMGTPEWIGIGDPDWKDDFVFKATGKLRGREPIGKNDWGDFSNARQALVDANILLEVVDALMIEIEAEVALIPAGGE